MSSLHTPWSLMTKIGCFASHLCMRDKSFGQFYRTLFPLQPQTSAECAGDCVLLSKHGYWASEAQPAHHLPLEHIFTLSGLRRAAPTFHIPTHSGNDSRPNFRILKKNKKPLSFWETCWCTDSQYSRDYIMNTRTFASGFWAFPDVTFWFSILQTVSCPLFFFSNIPILWSHFKQLHGLRIN